MDEEIVVCLERLFNPCTYLSATGEGIVTEQQVTDIKTAVEFFTKDPILDRHEDGIRNVWIGSRSSTTPLGKLIDKDERGRDHERKG